MSVLCSFLFFFLALAARSADSNDIGSGKPATNSALRTPHSEMEIPTVGMEGQVEIALPGSALEAKPVEPRAPIVVRIAATRPHGTLIHYDLRYIGMVPGTYDLRTNLARVDGSATADLPPIPVRIAGILPNQHRGELEPQRLSPLSFFGHYRTIMIAVAIFWGLLLIPLVMIGRKRRLERHEPLPVSAPTLADRLRPLVEQAAKGTLTRDGQAQLERMLFTYWRQRLGLQETGMMDSATRLRQHPEAGALIRELENWLHRPPGSVKVDVDTVLAPYRNLEASSPRP